MGDTLHLITVYSKTTAKAWFQYRVDAFLRSLAVFLREATGIIVIYFTLLKFDTLSGWNIYEMLFLFSLLFLTYGIMIIFFTGLRDFGKTVRDGSFDRFMLRPRGLLFQILFANACYYLITVAGGVQIQGAVFLFIATLNIYLLQTDSLKEMLYWDMRKFAGYPISIFNKFIQTLMIYVMPFAFVNYFPAQYFLRKEDMAAYPEVYIYLTPVVGIAMYILAYLFWRYSIRFYKSSGN